MSVDAATKGDFKDKQFAETEVADKVVEQCEFLFCFVSWLDSWIVGWSVGWSVGWFLLQVGDCTAMHWHWH